MLYRPLFNQPHDQPPMPSDTSPSGHIFMSNSDRDNPYTRAIAGFVCQLQANNIPAEVQTRIKLLILDSLGCALYGADLPWTRILQRSLGELDTTQAASVWGTSQRLSLPHATLINGTQIQGLSGYFGGKARNEGYADAMTRLPVDANLRDYYGDPLIQRELDREIERTRNIAFMM